MIVLAGAKVERVELVSQAVVRAFCHGSRKKNRSDRGEIFSQRRPAFRRAHSIQKKTP